ncbi:MAG: (Fe-S)-binding protein, partial [Anaerococcus obesiensis]
IKYYIKDYKNPYKKINCCGLGGGALDCEKDLVKDISNYMKENAKDNIYTYCSSCAGIFKNKYKLNNVKNFLSEILGTNESASSNYGKNILKFKFKNYRK